MIEKTLKRHDGKRVKIQTALEISWQGKKTWEQSIYICEPGKRSFFGVYSEYTIRYLKTQDLKQAYILAKQLEHVTPEELHQARLDLWETLKPEM